MTASGVFAAIATMSSRATADFSDANGEMAQLGAAVVGRELVCDERWGSANIAPAPKHKNQDLGDGGGASLQGRGGSRVLPRLCARHRALHALPVAGCSHCTGYARPRHRHGTGLSPEAALAAVGPTGHVTAADI